MPDKKFDLICIGRSCVDMYSGEFGVPIHRAMTFSKSLGGSPMNIAIGTSRLGLKVGAITGVGKEGNGDYIKWQLASEGVDISHVKTDPERLTAMVILSIRGKNDFPLIQYRVDCADKGRAHCCAARSTQANQCRPHPQAWRARMRRPGRRDPRQLHRRRSAARIPRKGVQFHRCRRRLYVRLFAWLAAR